MIGIIGAMEAEVAILKDTMEIEEVVEYAGMNFCRGKLNGREVVVVRSGIGKVNAAVCAQVLVDKFQAEVLINTGVAGSLDAAIDIGDIVISTAQCSTIWCNRIWRSAGTGSSDGYLPVPGR